MSHAFSSLPPPLQLVVTALTHSLDRWIGIHLRTHILKQKKKKKKKCESYDVLNLTCFPPFVPPLLMMTRMMRMSWVMRMLKMGMMMMRLMTCVCQQTWWIVDQTIHDTFHVFKINPKGHISPYSPPPPSYEWIIIQSIWIIIPNLCDFDFTTVHIHPPWLIFFYLFLVLPP